MKDLILFNDKMTYKVPTLLLSEDFDDNDEFSQTEMTGTVMPIFTDISGESDSNCGDIKQDDIPILPLRNMVLFPGVAMPVAI